MFVVFDLDGTVSLPGHRVHYIRRERRDYDAFYAACERDEPNWPVIRTMMTLAACADVRVEIWSGRSDVVREETVRWLEAHGVERRFLARMRPAGDCRPDVDLKLEWLREARAYGGAPDLVYDDRDCVVAMWRQEGVPCFQVAPGPF